MKRLSLIFLIAGSLAVFRANAQDAIRPVASSYTLQWGASQLEDTYLTPLKYTGHRFGLQYEGSQAMKFDPERWIMRFDAEMEFDLDKNPARNAKMAAFQASIDWNMLHRWQFPCRVTLGIGAGAQLSGGALYLSRNGNNPASAKAAATLNATGYATWSYKLWKIPFTLRYQPTLPITGAFFSPDYGQLYFQIYLGDHKNLAHAAWWGNYFMLDNLLTADIYLGKVALRLGYRGKIFSSKVNGLIANDFSHSLVLGITTDWITLGRGDKAPAGDIIHAY